MLLSFGSRFANGSVVFLILFFFNKTFRTGCWSKKIEQRGLHRSEPGGVEEPVSFSA